MFEKYIFCLNLHLHLFFPRNIKVIMSPVSKTSNKTFSCPDRCFVLVPRRDVMGPYSAIDHEQNLIRFHSFPHRKGRHDNANAITPSKRNRIWINTPPHTGAHLHCKGKQNGNKSCVVFWIAEQTGNSLNIDHRARSKSGRSKQNTMRQ